MSKRDVERIGALATLILIALMFMSLADFFDVEWDVQKFLMSIKPDFNFK